MLIAIATVNPVAALFNRYPSFQSYRNRFVMRTLTMPEEYAVLYPKLSDQTAFIFDYALLLNRDKRYDESNAILRQAKRFSYDPMLYNLEGNNCQALREYIADEAAYWHAAQLVPNHIYPYYLLAKLYHELGYTEKACSMAKTVLTKGPKTPSQAVEEMREEVEGFCKEKNYVD